MAEAGGRYADIATQVLERTEARTVVLIVAGGNRGDGFQVSSLGRTYLEALPAVLRDMAATIERDL